MCSFVSELIETLEEIDMEYKELALESGLENWGSVPALGCTSTFITDLADAVIEALPSATAMTQSTSESEHSKFSQDPVKFAIKMILGSFFRMVPITTIHTIPMLEKKVKKLVANRHHQFKIQMLPIMTGEVQIQE